jgi:copper resistance protein C
MNGRTLLVRFAALGLMALGAIAVSQPVMGASAEAAVVAEAEVRHLRLVRTAPEAESVVTGSPEEIRAVFSEPPQARGSTLRLTRGAEDIVATTDTSPDDEDPRQLVIRPEAPLAPGAYTVHWRVIAQDGHTQRGTWSFRVSAD